MWAPCGRPTWPHTPARPGPRPWLRVLSASSRECLRPPKPLGPGAPRALSATPGPVAASCVVSTHSGPGCIAARWAFRSLVRVWAGVCRYRLEMEGPEVGRPQPLLTGLNQDHFTTGADLGRWSSTRARWKRAAAAGRGRKKSGPAARADARSCGPLRSFEHLCGALAQMGLPAVAHARRARSRCDSQGSPSARPGAPVYGVRAVALAPNSGADFLLTVLDDPTGQGGRDRVRGARAPPTPALARAHRPRPHTWPTPRACAALRPPFALASPSPPLPCPWHAAPHMPSTLPALHARSLGPRARWRRARQLPRR